MISQFLLAIVAIFAGMLLWTLRKTKNKLPPGPKPWPLFGNALQMGRRPHVRFTEWSRIYGPIFLTKMGTMETIVVNDYKLIKELFSDSASTGRMTGNALVYEFAKGPNGIFNAEGPSWEEQRRFMIRVLQIFGLSKASMEGLILDEVNAMLDWFGKSKCTPISGCRIFNAPVVNSLWRIVSNERYEWEESRPPMLDTADAFFESMNEVSSNGLFFAPILRFIAPNYFGWNRYVKRVNDMNHIIMKSIKEHEDTLDPNNLRDFIDHVLVEIENTKNPESSFYKGKGRGYRNMIAGVFDLFLGGSETTSNILSWTLLYLSYHKEIQRKLQTEIDHVVGSRSPSLSDKSCMPFTEAVISEILRVTTVLPIGVPHCIVESETMFHGYHLPKGAAIFSNLYAVHRDPDTWGDPCNFRPERFLSADGSKFVRNEALIPFSEGKRKCIGETLSKNTLFLFITSIFQQFEVLPDPETQGKSDFEPEFGIVLAPKPFKVVMSPRN